MEQQIAALHVEEEEEEEEEESQDVTSKRGDGGDEGGDGGGSSITVKAGKAGKAEVIDLCSGFGYMAMFLSEMLPSSKVSKITLVDKMWPRHNASEVKKSHLNPGR